MSDVVTLTPIQKVAKLLETEDTQNKIKASLDGLGISPQRFVRTALAALSTNTYVLQKCNPGSIVAAVLRAATLGLELDPTLAHAYVVPRGGDATLQVSYKGKIALAYRTGNLLAIDVGDICENDKVNYTRGTAPRLEVSPPLTSARGKVVAYYCAAQWKNGGSTVEVMSLEEILQHRDKFSDEYKRSGAASVWGKNQSEMCIKTVVLRASKRWPTSVADDTESEENYVDADYRYMRTNAIEHNSNVAQLTHDVQDAEVVTANKSSRLSAFVTNRS